MKKILFTVLLFLPIVGYAGLEDASIFPYKASDQQKERMKSGYRKLKLGSTKEQAKELLGEPDISQKDFTKSKKRKFIGYSYQYYFFKLHKDFVNSGRDKVILLFFNEEGNLKWGVPSNIEGLEEIGSPNS